jgi:hypothetical protein
MASKNFNQNSSGQSFEATSNGYTDLSALSADALVGHESMAGGNTVTAKEGDLQMAAPGTQSEQTATNILGKKFDANEVTDPTAGGLSKNIRKAKDHG